VNKDYKEAERAYLMAMKWGGQNDDDLGKLLTVYYRSRDKAMEAKADNLLDAWWWRQNHNKLSFYAIFCVMTAILALTGMIGQLLTGLLILLYLYLALGKMLNHRKSFAWGVRAEENISGIIGNAVLMGVWIVFKLLALGIGFTFVASSGIGAMFGSALETVESLLLVRLLEKLIGIVCGIAFLYSFNKGVSVLQSDVSQWETEFLKKLFGLVLFAVRIVSTIVTFIVSYEALVNDSLELVVDFLSSL